MDKKSEAAFPINNDFLSEPGMTLRDYIAIHATDKDIESFRKSVKRRFGPYVIEHYTLPIPQARYAYADAMLQERDQ